MRDVSGGWRRAAHGAALATTMTVAACGGGGGGGGDAAPAPAPIAPVTSPAPAAPVDAPVIATQPQSLTVAAGDIATLRVAATASAPLSYQWRRNGIDIAGATAASYTTPPVQASDTGQQYSVVVRNGQAAVTSDVAILTVSPLLQSADRVRLATSNGYTLALLVDGSVIVWGGNSGGQLGAATPIGGSAARLVGIPSGVVSIGGGANEAIGLRADGVVLGWGRRTVATVAGGDASTSSSPIVAPRAATFPTGIAAIAISDDGLRSLALRGDGTVWFLPGEAVSTGPTSVRVDARQVPGLAGVRSIASGAGGNGRAVAVRSDGTVWQITASGGPTSWAATPGQVAGLADIRRAACGPLHCLALAGDGTVWAWGSNQNGKLGNDSATDSATPVRSIGLANVVAIAAGTVSSHAITADGRVWNWGSGALAGGGSPTEPRLVPTVMPDFADAVEITAGNAVLIRRANGSVWGWGSNVTGELGDGNVGVMQQTPVQALGVNLQ